MTNKGLTTLSYFISFSTLTLAVTSFFVPILEFVPDATFNFITGRLPSIFLSFSILAIMSVSLYYINNSYFLVSNRTLLLPMLFLFMAFINPEVLFFSKYHLIALLLLWAIFYNIRYEMEEEHSKEALFLTYLMMSISAALEPVLIWVMAVQLLISVIRLKINFVRFTVVVLGAITIPFLYLFAYRYILTDSIGFDSFFTYFFLRSKSFIVHPFPTKIVTIFLDVVLVLLIGTLTLFYLKSSIEIKPIAKRSFGIALSFMLLLLPLCLFFKGLSLAAIPPLSIFLYFYIVRNLNRKGANFMLVIFVLAVLLERISLFLI